MHDFTTLPCLFLVASYGIVQMGKCFFFLLVLVFAFDSTQGEGWSVARARFRISSYDSIVQQLKVAIFSPPFKCLRFAAVFGCRGKCADSIVRLERQDGLVYFSSFLSVCG